MHDQRETLIGLGLNKIGRTRRSPDTPATRGMIDKVKHMVRSGRRLRGTSAMKLQRNRRQSRLAPEAHRASGAASARAKARPAAAAARARPRVPAYRNKGFEGGQMPLHRRLPKRGFRNTSFADQAQRGQPRRRAGGDRRRHAQDRRRDRCRRDGQGRPDAPRQGGVKLLGGGEFKAKAQFSVWRASQVGDRRGRKGRRLGHDPGAEEGRRRRAARQEQARGARCGERRQAQRRQAEGESRQG